MRTAAAVFLQQGRLGEAEAVLRQLLVQARAARVDASHAVVLQVRAASGDGRGGLAPAGAALALVGRAAAYRARFPHPCSQASLALADVLARVASSEAPAAPPVRLEEAQALLGAALRTLKSQVCASSSAARCVSPNAQCALLPLSHRAE